MQSNSRVMSNRMVEIHFKNYPLEDREAVPLGGDQFGLVCLNKLRKGVVSDGTIRLFSEGAADNDERLLGGLELLRKWTLAGNEIGESLRVGAQVVIPICGICTLANVTNFQASV